MGCSPRGCRIAWLLGLPPPGFPVGWASVGSDGLGLPSRPGLCSRDGARPTMGGVHASTRGDRVPEPGQRCPKPGPASCWRGRSRYRYAGGQRPGESAIAEGMGVNRLRWHRSLGKSRVRPVACGERNGWLTGQLHGGDLGEPSLCGGLHRGRQAYGADRRSARSCLAAAR